MDHEKAGELLPEAPHGRLPEADAKELSRHVAECQDCRESGAVYAFLARSLASEVDHPEADAVARLAAGGSPPPERDALAQHLDGCQTCRDELTCASEALRAAGAPPTPRRHARAGGWPVALAAGLVGAALSAGLLQLRPGPAVVRSEPRGGFAETLILGEALRGGDASPLLRTRPGDAMLLLALTPSVLPSAEGRVRAEIRGGAGAQAWSTELAVSEARRMLADHGALFLMVPASRLPPGDYRVRLLVAEEAVFDRAFRVR